MRLGVVVATGAQLCPVVGSARRVAVRWGNGFDELRCRGDIADIIRGEVVSMTNILVRGLTDRAVRRIDAEAKALGLSRNEYLRRKLESGTAEDNRPLAEEDWRNSAAVFADLGDPGVMDSAWR